MQLLLGLDLKERLVREPPASENAVKNGSTYLEMAVQLTDFF